jgi:TonB family protein
MAAAPQKVQTGGFGDPNGVPASDNHGRPVTIAQAGSYDMPYGPGYPATARADRMAPAAWSPAPVLAAASPPAIVPAQFPVRAARFARAASETPTWSRSAAQTKSAEPAVKTLPAEITFKPRPVYTDEGRQLKIEGEVLLDVVFSASGQIRIVKVVRGLGHGLDESAVHAAEKIQFKPAQKDGHPADFEAVLHIEFQLAS